MVTKAPTLMADGSAGGSICRKRKKHTSVRIRMIRKEMTGMRQVSFHS